MVTAIKCMAWSIKEVWRTILIEKSKQKSNFFYRQAYFWRQSRPMTIGGPLQNLNEGPLKANIIWQPSIILYFYDFCLKTQIN